MTNIRRNEIYFASVEFSDKPIEKTRPVVVISKNSYNSDNPDVIVCAMTTNSSHNCFVPLSQEVLSEGKFFEESGIRYDGIQKLAKVKFKQKIGKITDEFHKKLVEKIVGLIG